MRLTKIDYCCCSREPMQTEGVRNQAPQGEQRSNQPDADEQKRPACIQMSGREMNRTVYSRRRRRRTMKQGDERQQRREQEYDHPENEARSRSEFWNRLETD